MCRRVRGQGRLTCRVARVPLGQGREVVDPRNVRVHRRGPEDERRQVRQEGAAPAAEGRRAGTGWRRPGDGESLTWGESNADKLRRLFDRFWNHGDWEAGTAVLAP